MSSSLPNPAGPVADLFDLHRQRLDWLERASGPILALLSEYPDGYRVPEHHHSRAQLLHALSGVVLVRTQFGRWMVPPDHAIWIPAAVEHEVEMLGQVSMRSIYVAPDAMEGLPAQLRVVGVSNLMRALIVEAVEQTEQERFSQRGELLSALMLQEIPRLPERPLGLPFPADTRMAASCRRFVGEPSPHTTIDEWANAVGMSRRSFTRVFHRETGLSFSAWRQQALLFAALPRLADGESVTQVALDLGYESVPAFTTMFKRMIGLTPRDYMRGVRDAEKGPTGSAQP